MRILMIVKYLPIQGGVSTQNYWLAQTLAELGHSVVVLTNAGEVEEEYRVQLNEEDRKKLSGFRKKNSIEVISTRFDENEFHIPYSKPFSSKLLSLGLELCENFKPDFMFAHYVEPYGVVAMNLSALTGVPYTIMHAGSDLEKLSKIPQLKTLHELVYRRATLVATQAKHWPYFKGIGIMEERLSVLTYKPCPADVFFPTSPPIRGDVCHLLIYGKTGRAKGTDQLIDALGAYPSEEPKIRISAYWGERLPQRYLDKITLLRLVERGLLELHPFVPHWKVAKAISKSHGVLYLENNFKISIHGPGIPFEALGCGRRLITTDEIANKYPKIIKGSNACIIKGAPFQVDDLLSVLIKFAQRLDLEQTISNDVDLRAIYLNGVRSVEQFLERVRKKLS